MELKPWIRRGQVIFTPEGVATDHKSINKAKKASRELQKGGSTVRVEEDRTVKKVARARQFLSKSQERRFTAMQAAKFRREITAPELAEIADNLLLRDPTP